MLQPKSISEYRVALKVAEVKNVRLEAEVGRLQERVRELEGRLEAALRTAKRQAAPFSKGAPKTNPKRPGRRAGRDHGRHGHRQAPDRVDEIVPVLAPSCCSDCGSSEMERCGVEVQWQEEAPPPRPTVRRFEIHVARCRRCGRSARGRHPWQTSSAVGASAAQVGGRAQALAARLHYELGLSMGRTAAVLQDTVGIEISRGGVAQILARLGERCEPSYQGLVKVVRQDWLAVLDETGWRVGGLHAWLWVAATGEMVVYAIRQGRGFEEAAFLLGESYAGILVRDGWGVYRRFQLARHQTCLAHLLRRCDEIAEATWGRGREIPKKVKAILLDALQLRARRDRGEIGTDDFGAELCQMEERVRAQLARPVNSKPSPQGRLLRHLVRELEALFTFLQEPGVPATNWLAEQALRPAIVNRKVWGGNRTWNGARSQERLMSVLGSLRCQGQDPIKALAALLCRSMPALVTGLALPGP
jgi:transposase